MLSVFLSFLASVLGELAKSWFAEQDVVNSGKVQQQVLDMKANAQVTNTALQARTNTIPITNINSVPINDPNFRD